MTGRGQGKSTESEGREQTRNGAGQGQTISDRISGACGPEEGSRRMLQKERESDRERESGRDLKLHLMPYALKAKQKRLQTGREHCRSQLFQANTAQRFHASTRYHPARGPKYACSEQREIRKQSTRITEREMLLLMRNLGPNPIATALVTQLKPQFTSRVRDQWFPPGHLNLSLSPRPLRSVEAQQSRRACGGR